MSQQPNNYTELIYRVGTFFLLIGIGSVILFVLSDAARQTAFSYLCWGLIFLIVGFACRSQYKKTVTPSGRFSIFKRLRPKPKEKK